MKITFTIFIVIFWTNIFGQIADLYNGKSLASVSIINNDTIEKYNYKQLVFNTDNTFVFWMRYYTDNATCLGCIDTIWVSGNWVKQKDTLILNSKYQAKDFMKINSFYSKNEHTTFVYNTFYFCYDSDILIINDTISLNIHCSDVGVIKVNTVLSIKLKKYLEHNFLYELTYKPDIYKANLFTINSVDCIRDKYNMSFFQNEKLLIKDNYLVPLNCNELINVNGEYKK